MDIVKVFARFCLLWVVGYGTGYPVDNAPDRMLSEGVRVGLLDHDYASAMQTRMKNIEVAIDVLNSTRVKPGQATECLPVSKDGAVLVQIARRPDVDWVKLAALDPTGTLASLDADESRAVLTRVRYEGYIAREQIEADRLEKYEALKIPDDIDYQSMPSLSNELRGRLSQKRPATIGEAGRLEGVTPAAIAALLVKIR